MSEVTLVLEVFSDDSEYTDLPERAVITITPERAKQIRYLADMVHYHTGIFSTLSIRCLDWTPEWYKLDYDHEEAGQEPPLMAEPMADLRLEYSVIVISDDQFWYEGKTKGDIEFDTATVEIKNLP